ncbi:hypothetical protein Dimus_031449 [Dionaea muscipula]
MGSGVDIRFWQDHWTGTQPLMLSFPRLFRLAAAPECAVADCVEVGEAGQEWKVGFQGVLRSRNQEDLRSLIGALPDANEVRAGRVDKVAWIRVASWLQAEGVISIDYAKALVLASGEVLLQLLQGGLFFFDPCRCSSGCELLNVC